MTDAYKTLWIIHQYASGLDVSGGRHSYLAQGLVRLGHRVYVTADSYTHLRQRAVDADQKYPLGITNGWNYVRVRVPPYSSARDKQRTLNWFLFSWRLRGREEIIEHQPYAVLVSSPHYCFLGRGSISHEGWRPNSFVRFAASGR